METSQVIIEVIRSIPPGKVLSYGAAARMAGIPNGARQVVRVLHSSSARHALPWWRVIRSDGSIALAEDTGGVEQRELLELEGVGFLPNGRVDMLLFAWQES